MIRIGIAALVATLSTLGLTSVAKHNPPQPEAPVQEVKNKHKRWTLRNGTPEEKEVLEFFQDQGINDRAALAVLLGNIKQESRFDVKVCEGGARTGYWACNRGGFGLIQWTTSGRYHGLGKFARNNGCDPNSLNCQLRYLTSEVEWRKVEQGFKAEGKSIQGYMNLAKRWLGWGVHGARTDYSWSYYNQLS